MCIRDRYLTPAESVPFFPGRIERSAAAKPAGTLRRPFREESRGSDVVGRVKTYEAIIKGENIPEPGVPESFKVLLKEMQSLGLDVQVLRDDGTEVEMNENIDYGDTELRAMLEGERRFEEKESYAQFGYQEQEFKDSELVAVEEEEEVSADDYTEEADDEDDLFLDEAADGEDEE